MLVLLLCAGCRCVCKTNAGRRGPWVYTANIIGSSRSWPPYCPPSTTTATEPGITFVLFIDFDNLDTIEASDRFRCAASCCKRGTFNTTFNTERPPGLCQSRDELAEYHAEHVTVHRAVRVWEEHNLYGTVLRGLQLLSGTHLRLLTVTIDGAVSYTLQRPEATNVNDQWACIRWGRCGIFTLPSEINISREGVCVR